ncbi:cyclin-dependent kinase 2-interacting protein isoform X2 [Cavia porcellus]|uniref:cyclin-dependent kinase 2-interacting protein isoform X2 n=1 Tax=Cavia porcellus TaxID=10141 RepID=UPI002FDF85DC
MEAKPLGAVVPQKPVLSVSARKIKDNAADWHNLIQKWEALNDAGFATANSIANLKISLLSRDKAEPDSSSPASEDDEEKTHPDYDKELETLCEELQATLEGLTKIQVKMEKLSSTTKGICELENYYYGEETRRPLLFHTWPTAHFSGGQPGLHSEFKASLDDRGPVTSKQTKTQKAELGAVLHGRPGVQSQPACPPIPDEVAHKLSHMYSCELHLKRTLAAELAHTSDRDLILSFLSMWLHQPYVERDSGLLLESMLLETGHRTL